VTDTRKATEEPELLTEKTLTYWCTQKLVQILLFPFFRLRVRGRENLPREGGAVIASNHQSMMDIPIVAAANRRHVCFVARETLADTRWLAVLMRECGAVLIERGATDRKALRDMVRHLEQGDLLTVFPEGTRSRDGKLGEFKRGAVLTARKAGVPLIPTAITGAIEAMPRGKALPRPRRVGIEFGAPIDSSLPDAQEQLVAAVQEMVGEGRFRAR
jgi:1-acyl-sn-glycerol-3-phosphate acyltransferase